MARYILLAILLSWKLAGFAQQGSPPPIIDVHVHANPISGTSTAGESIVTNVESFLTMTFPRARNGSASGLIAGHDTLPGARTDDEFTERILSILREHNIIAVASGALAGRWKAAAPDHIILSSWETDTTALRSLVASGGVQALGEYGFQYMGMAPADSLPMAVFAFAESHDLPIGIHMGPGPPGSPYVASPTFRARLGSPLGLEEVLNRFPRLRLNVMHAGWPMLDEIIALMYTYPQVYIDLGVLDWVFPRKEFYRYLQRLVEAGFGKRIMNGSDEMSWPDAITVAIHNIESAPFLTQEQKRDILYNNAARFLRLDGPGVR
jgi:hypothetical protein